MAQSEGQLEERRRKYDERWMQEMINGIARIHTVLSDVSDICHTLADAQRDRKVEARQPPAEQPLMLTVKQTAELLNMSEGSVRTNGPTVTKVGGRVMFQRVDIDKFLEAKREPPIDRDGRFTYRPGQIGATLKAPPVRQNDVPNCPGSDEEPSRPSPYSGRGICAGCGDDQLLRKNGSVRKHKRRSGW